MPFRRALTTRLVATSIALAFTILGPWALPTSAQGPQDVASQDAAPPVGADLIEDFEDAADWWQINLSEPIGKSTWSYGNEVTAHEGTPRSFVTEGFAAAAGNGTASSWLGSPVITDITNGDTWSFWTRSIPVPDYYADRLEVRLSTNDSCDPGTGSNSVGDFTTVLTTANRQLTTTGYPRGWTRYSGTISGLTEPATGCLGFRYYVTNSGPDGTNGGAIGVDTVTYTQVDLLPPTASWETTPTGTVNTDAVEVTFGADEAATFECQLDDGDWASCSSPASFTDLVDGDHTIAVRATDTANNLGQAISTTFTVKRPATATGPKLTRIKLTAPKKVRAGKKFKATVTGLVPGAKVAINWAGKTKRLTVPAGTTKLTVTLKAPRAKKNKKVKLTATATAAAKKLSASTAIKVRRRP